MGIPIQEILELIFVGVLALTVLLICVVVLTGGKHPRIGRPLAYFLFHATPRPWQTAGGIIDSGSSQFDGFFRGLVVLSLIYSVGISIDRISDAMREDPGDLKNIQCVLPIVGDSDNAIRRQVFRDPFEPVWPEAQELCRPYQPVD